MVSFTGLEFLFRFFPAFLAVYYITPKKYRNTTLLLGSIIFYAVGEPYYVLLLLVIVWLNYFFAKNIFLQGYPKGEKMPERQTCYGACFGYRAAGAF